MKDGNYQEGEHVLRAKIDMTSPNMLMRDPIMFRIVKKPHLRTETAGQFIQCMIGHMVNLTTLKTYHTHYVHLNLNRTENYMIGFLMLYSIKIYSTKTARICKIKFILHCY